MKHALLFFLFSCGPSPFVGAWAGPAFADGVCKGEPSFTSPTVMAKWTIEEVSDGQLAVFSGACRTATAKESDTTHAYFAPKLCDAAPNVQLTILSGGLELKGEHLTLTMESSRVLVPSLAFCTFTTVGELERVP